MLCLFYFLMTMIILSSIRPCKLSQFHAILAVVFLNCSFTRLVLLHLKFNNILAVHGSVYDIMSFKLKLFI
jgi:hypothetical protein